MPAPAQKPGRSKQDYCTPKPFLQAAREFLDITEFEADLAASHENAVVNPYYTEEQSALDPDNPWRLGDGWNWCNPPFGHISPWVEKAYLQCLTARAQTCMLLPAGVGSNWFREFVHHKCLVLFLNGRITFEGCEDPYPKDLMLLLYSPYVGPGYDFWRWRK